MFDGSSFDSIAFNVNALCDTKPYFGKAVVVFNDIAIRGYLREPQCHHNFGKRNDIGGNLIIFLHLFIDIIWIWLLLNSAGLEHQDLISCDSAWLPDPALLLWDVT